ncbi:MFS transporter [Asticcacaulis taihuensis]|uniref:MFS transporter n=1 Tax=Asticcacaulis taihuensis TaxID=260084 RepID=UPI003F7B8087
MTSAKTTLTPALVGLFALACGVVVGNLYYGQPIIALIAPDVGLSKETASLIVSLTQIGYGLGLLFIVPLADRTENRRLTLILLAAAFLSLLMAAVATNGILFLIVSLLIGLATVAVQVLIPLAAHMATDENRGRVVGNIMGGLVLGILLSRPLSSLIADHFGWRAVYFTAAAFMVLMGGLLALTLPSRQPDHKVTYVRLIHSLSVLWRAHPALRLRTLFQACMFCAFSLFWTVAPLELASRFHLSQTQIALFALVGATGALAAPLSGRLADAGHTVKATFGALAVGAAAMLITLLPAMRGVIVLALLGVVLDFCVQMNMVQGQRAIYALDPMSRGRVNGIYMAGIFTGGAIGSAVASTLYESGGWAYVALAGGLAPLLALGVFALNYRKA